MFFARGYNYATALEAALKTKVCTGVCHAQRQRMSLCCFTLHVHALLVRTASSAEPVSSLCSCSFL
jgi:hypothetical protein